MSYVWSSLFCLAVASYSCYCEKQRELIQPWSVACHVWHSVFWLCRGLMLLMITDHEKAWSQLSERRKERQWWTSVLSSCPLGHVVQWQPFVRQLFAFCTMQRLLKTVVTDLEFSQLWWKLSQHCWLYSMARTQTGSAILVPLSLVLPAAGWCWCCSVTTLVTWHGMAGCDSTTNQFCHLGSAAGYWPWCTNRFWA